MQDRLCRMSVLDFRPPRGCAKCLRRYFARLRAFSSIEYCCRHMQFAQVTAATGRTFTPVRATCRWAGIASRRGRGSIFPSCCGGPSGRLFATLRVQRTWLSAADLQSGRRCYSMPSGRKRMCSSVLEDGAWHQKRINATRTIVASPYLMHALAMRLCHRCSRDV